MNSRLLCTCLAVCVLSLLPVSAQSETPKPGGCPRRVLPADRCVANQTDECQTDADCSGVAKCCSTGCAKFCVLPVYTACEQQAEYTLRRSRSLAPHLAKELRMPKCDQFGEFEPIQCDVHDAVGSKCWCVDRNGFEMAGTRARSLDLVNCSRRHECAAVTCRMLCPYRFRLDSDGCPLCQCWDPCQGVVCPGQTACQLEQVACANEPCPPVPTCKKARSLESLCVSGRPLTFAEGSRPFICGSQPGQPSCPALHECTVPQGAEYGVCCPSIRSVLKPPAQCAATGAASAQERCGQSCQFSFQCADTQTCCRSPVCGTHCQPSSNLTDCEQRRLQAEVIVRKVEGSGGYVPQCSADGSFERRQCSRNGLVCWCVAQDGHNIQGTMAPADQVVCSRDDASVFRARSLQCQPQRCAQVCPYGFQRDISGCPTCLCAEPCDGFPCPQGQLCHVINDPACRAPICDSRPVCVSNETVADVQYHITPPEPSEDTDSTLADPHAQDLGVPLDDTYVDNEENGVYEDGMAEKHISSTVNDMLEEEDSDVDEDATEQAQTSTELLDEGDLVGDTALDYSDPAELDDHLPDDDDTVDSQESLADDLQVLYDLESQASDNVVFSDSVDGESSGGGASADEARATAADGTSLTEPATAESVVQQVFAVLGQQRRHRPALVLEASQARAWSLARQLTLAPPADGAADGVTVHVPYQPMTEHNDTTPQTVAADTAHQNEKPGQCPYAAPVVGSSTAASAADGDHCSFQCDSDDMCSGQAKCCSTGCGTRCTEPILATACQHLKAALEERARLLSIPAGRTYIPQCRDSDGAFESIQCHRRLGVCWCVDAAGSELANTRAVGRHSVNCDGNTTAVCDPLTCATYCPHGRRLDSRGCRTCQCHEPCDQLSCPAGLQCRAVQLRCVAQPCPPTPLCVTPATQPCGAHHAAPGAPCGPGRAPCPGSHRCRVSPFGEPSVCCPKSRDVCQLPQQAGHCGDSHVRWFSDVVSGDCRPFNYSGCGGNENNFHSQQQCLTVCPELTPCQRQREHNMATARRYSHVTYVPQCDPVSGEWEPLQCQSEFGLCWCVDPASGRQVDGSMQAGTRDTHSGCSGWRQSRHTAHTDHTNMCAAGVTVHVCDGGLCSGRVCAAQPDAQCRVDPCGGCSTRFYSSSGAELNCTLDLTPCQQERQQLMNSPGWRNLGRYTETDTGTAELQQSLVDISALRLENSRQSARWTEQDGAGAPWRHSPLSGAMSVAPPQCDSRGRYSSGQRDGALAWCVNSEGRPQHATLTRGTVRCSDTGELVARSTMGAVCPFSDQQPRVCHDTCASVTCPGHERAVCVADPCNNCSVTFYSVDGAELVCQDACLQPVSAGLCRGALPRYYYDSGARRCRQFFYGGCGGNDNNFATEAACTARCHTPVDVCVLPPVDTVCNHSSERWFYNAQTATCQQYSDSGGCGGGANTNSFASQQQCLHTCPDWVMCPSSPGSAVPCSRRRACSGATCRGHDQSLSCRVEPCSCRPYFVDTSGNTVNCSVFDDAAMATDNMSEYKKPFKTQLAADNSVAPLHTGSTSDNSFTSRASDERETSALFGAHQSNPVEMVVAEPVAQMTQTPATDKHSERISEAVVLPKLSEKHDDNSVSQTDKHLESLDVAADTETSVAKQPSVLLPLESVSDGWVTLDNTDVPAPEAGAAASHRYTEIVAAVPTDFTGDHLWQQQQQQQQQQQHSGLPGSAAESGQIDDDDDGDYGDDDVHERHGSRQARLLSGRGSFWQPAGLSEPVASVASSRRHQLLAPAGVQREVALAEAAAGGGGGVGGSGSALPALPVLVSVVCAGVVAGLAALTIAAIVYRRSSRTDEKLSASAPGERMSSSPVLSGRSLDEQLAEFGDVDSRNNVSSFRWNF